MSDSSVHTPAQLEYSFLDRLGINEREPLSTTTSLIPACTQEPATIVKDVVDKIPGLKELRMQHPVIENLASECCIVICSSITSDSREQITM